MSQKDRHIDPTSTPWLLKNAHPDVSLSPSRSRISLVMYCPPSREPSTTYRQPRAYGKLRRELKSSQRGNDRISPAVTPTASKSFISNPCRIRAGKLSSLGSGSFCNSDSSGSNKPRKRRRTSRYTDIVRRSSKGINPSSWSCCARVAVFTFASRSVVCIR